MVGIKIDNAVHFQEDVSFFIVRQVVEQGQCIRENNITETAVVQVHPLSIRSCFNIFKLSISTKFPVAI